MNIWTWNVNSIRSKIDEVNNLIKKYNIDVLVITETKIKPEHESMVSKQIDTEYLCIWNSNKNSYYHGVSFIYKKSINMEILSDVLPRLVSDVDQSLCCMKNKVKVNNCLTDMTGLINDMNKAQKTEGRIITVKCTLSQEKTDKTDKTNGTEIVIVGTYVPNSGVTRGDSLRRLGYRVLVWDKDMYAYLLQLQQKYKNVIWIGDLNVARKSNDMNSNAPTCAGTTPEERINMNNFLQSSGWIDTWDHINHDIDDYHHRWTYGMGKGPKLRLDYIVCSPEMKNSIVSSKIDQQFGTSDHVPMGTIFSFC